MSSTAQGAHSTPADRGGQAVWLRVYLGYAPGVGKTLAMLHEGRRRHDRGTDVVAGWIEAYDRPRTLEAIGDLEVIPPSTLTRGGVVLREMDVAAILARRPQVALVDELAHSNVSGSPNQKRYQDVLQLRAAGINVISTLNIQHLASLQDTLRVVAGATIRETLPDWVLDSADELEMIDQSPEALRKRLSHGNVLPRDQIDRALDGYFGLETLTALRELTLRRVAQHTAQRRQAARPGGGPEAPGLAPSETVLVCLPRGAEAQLVLRRGIRLADQLGARLMVAHVTQPGRVLASGYSETMRALQLARALGAEVHELPSSRVADALVRFAQTSGATQLVLGESTRGRLRELLQGSTVREVLRRTRDVDVHIVRRTEA